MVNYPHNVIRIKKSKPNLYQTYRFVSILNKKKQSSQKMRHKIGFYKQGKHALLSINGNCLGGCLNSGVILNESVKKYLYLNFYYSKGKK